MRRPPVTFHTLFRAASLWLLAVVHLAALAAFVCAVGQIPWFVLACVALALSAYAGAYYGVRVALAERPPAVAVVYRYADVGAAEPSVN